MDEKEASGIWDDEIVVTDVTEVVDVEVGAGPAVEDAVEAEVVVAEATSVVVVTAGMTEVTASMTVSSVSSMVEWSQIT